MESDPVSISIAISKALSHFNWNKTCTITTIYYDSGVESTFVDRIQNPEELSLWKVCYAATVTCAAVNYVSKSYTRDVCKLNPAITDTDRPTFQRRARSKIIASWIQSCFNEESLKTLMLENDNYQLNSTVCNSGWVKCNRPTMIKLIFLLYSAKYHDW